MAFLDNAKAVKDAIQEVASLEAKQDLLRIVNEALAIQARNRELEEEVRTITAALEFEGTLRFDRNVYWSGNDPNPFCTACFDIRRQAVRLSWVHATYCRCPGCDKSFDLEPFQTGRARVGGMESEQGWDRY